MGLPSIQVSAIGRDHCYRCDKVQELCICRRVAAVRQRTRVTVIHHPREARHPFGTVRIVRLGLDDCHVHVAHGEKVGFGDRLTARTAVLFPHPDAVDLEDLPADALPDHLVVVDGTWPQARRLMRVNPVLRALPRVSFRQGPTSNYRIRKEPTLTSLSTVEAVVHALRLIEPDTRELTGLLSAFDGMVDDQLALRASLESARRSRRRPRPQRTLPSSLLVEPDRLVLMHAELHRPKGQKARHPLRVTVASDRGRGDWLVCNDGPVPSPSRIKNMELGAARFGDPPLNRAELSAALATHVRDDSVLLAWPHSAEGLVRELGTQSVFVAVKHVVANLGLSVEGLTSSASGLQQRGALTARFSGEGPLAFPGRAGRNLFQLAQVVDALRHQLADAATVDRVLP